MAYTDLAPTMDSVGLTQAEIEVEFSNMPTPPVPNPDPTITKVKVQAVLAAWCTGSLGVGEIAQDNNLTPNQVKVILREIMDAHSAHEAGVL
jgi:hypothetical protein